MRSILPQILPFCTTALAALARTNPAQQELPISKDIMAKQDNSVPSHNNDIYDIVPKEDQIFKIEFLQVAPTPIIA
ncbi:hypothetical protein BJX64DRAFT_270510 [Aspergillus heterothallicus]